MRDFGVGAEFGVLPVGAGERGEFADHASHRRAVHGDAVLQVFLLWSMFLPLGRAFSLDQIFSNKVKYNSQHYFSAATLIFIGQIAFIYFMTGFAKTGSFWLNDHAGVAIAFSLHEFAKPLGSYLLPHKDLLKVLTVLTVYSCTCPH